MSAASTATLLAGRRILVTGAARGLGLAFVDAIAAAGATVAMADILQQELAASVAALKQRGLQVEGFALDLADPASVKACAAPPRKWLGRLDGLVNNAAITNSAARAASSWRWTCGTASWMSTCAAPG
jgi:NAD(P)-dependent dehydrogenase (short-subunit alcohol dehydrogenase family)